MSKKYKDKPCIYCQSSPSTRTGDHVFAREFFLEEQRGNLPKVPACERCNNEKSKLEHYLTATLPFGGVQSEAARHLAELVPDRLANNARLHRELRDGHGGAVMTDGAGQEQSVMTLPFDGQILHDLFHFIVRGVLFYHWRVALGPEHDSRVISVTQAGEEAFAHFLSKLLVQQSIANDLGNETFVYEGQQGKDDPALTVWKFSVFGGALLAGRGEDQRATTTGLRVVTARREVLVRPAVINVFGEDSFFHKTG